MAKLPASMNRFRQTRHALKYTNQFVDVMTQPIPTPAMPQQMGC